MSGAGMLVLSRKPLQSFKVGDDVTITVLDVTRNQVKIGIKAPKSVLVLRTELTKRKY